MLNGSDDAMMCGKWGIIAYCMGCIDYRHRERLAGFTGPVVVRLDEMAIERERDSGAFAFRVFLFRHQIHSVVDHCTGNRE